MKKSWIKMMVALVVAVAIGAGYYMYVQPSEGAIAYVATTNLVTGETIQPNMVRSVHIRGNETIPSVNATEIIGKTIRHSIESGDWVNPSMLSEQKPKNIRYYTLHLSYVQADGALLREGIKVDVWAEASDTTQPHKVLSDVPIFKIVTQGAQKVAAGEDLNVVLALHDEQIAAIEAAKQQSSLFFVVKGDEQR